jgi:hypothetical protein
MSRTRNATVAAPESPASVQTDTRPTPATIGAQDGAGLTGTCKLCGEPMELLESGFWIHWGIGFLVHSAVLDDQREAVKA